MCRLIINSVIALRVILCPLFCAVGNGDLCALGGETGVTCTCSERHDEPCQRDGSSAPLPCDSPGNCPIPCDAGCVCQVAPELNSRMAAGIELSINFLPVCFDSPDVSEIAASRCEERPHRHDLSSGRSIRLVFASLLL